jgi:virulence-associated protein VagC
MSNYKERHNVTQTRCGNSMSIRLTQGFTYPAKEKLVMRRYGDRIIIEPETPKGWPEDFLALLENPDPDFPDVK